MAMSEAASTVSGISVNASPEGEALRAKAAASEIVSVARSWNAGWSQVRAELEEVQADLEGVTPAAAADEEEGPEASPLKEAISGFRQALLDLEARKERIRGGSESARWASEGLPAKSSSVEALASGEGKSGWTPTGVTKTISERGDKRISLEVQAALEQEAQLKQCQIMQSAARQSAALEVQQQAKRRPEYFQISEAAKLPQYFAICSPALDQNVSEATSPSKDVALNAELWEVVGGEEDGGVPVSVGAQLTSKDEPQLLSHGAFVKRLELEGSRLKFYRLTGTGPDVGWVSTKVDGKELLSRRGSAKRQICEPKATSRFDWSGGRVVEAVREPGGSEGLQVKLFRCSGGESDGLSEVPLHHSSLCAGDAFVLDAGGTIYVWHGEGAAGSQRARAEALAESFALQRPGVARVAHKVGEEFWELLGSSGPAEVARQEVALQQSPPVVERPVQGSSPWPTPREQAPDSTLYRICTLDHEVLVQEVPCSRDSLQGGECFVLDTGTKVYVWRGEGALPMERYRANVLAEGIEAERKARQSPGVTVTLVTHEIDDGFWKCLDAPVNERQRLGQPAAVASAVAAAQEAPAAAAAAASATAASAVAASAASSVATGLPPTPRPRMESARAKAESMKLGDEVNQLIAALKKVEAATSSMKAPPKEEPTIWSLKASQAGGSEVKEAPAQPAAVDDPSPVAPPEVVSLASPEPPAPRELQGPPVVAVIREELPAAPVTPEAVKAEEPQHESSALSHEPVTKPDGDKPEGNEPAKQAPAKEREVDMPQVHRVEEAQTPVYMKPALIAGVLLLLLLACYGLWPSTQGSPSGTVPIPHVTHRPLPVPVPLPSPPSTTAEPSAAPRPSPHPQPTPTPEPTPQPAPSKAPVPAPVPVPSGMEVKALQAQTRQLWRRMRNLDTERRGLVTRWEANKAKVREAQAALPRARSSFKAAQQEAEKAKRTAAEARQQLAAQQTAANSAAASMRQQQQEEESPFLRQLQDLPLPLQWALTVVLAALGAWGLLGPEKFMQPFLTAVGSCVAGLLMCVALLSQQAASPDVHLSDMVLALLEGNAPVACYALWAGSAALGFLRFLLGFECALWAYVDDAYVDDNGSLAGLGAPKPEAKPYNMAQADTVNQAKGRGGRR